MLPEGRSRAVLESLGQMVDTSNRHWDTGLALGSLAHFRLWAVTLRRPPHTVKVGTLVCHGTEHESRTQRGSSLPQEPPRRREM